MPIAPTLADTSTPDQVHRVLGKRRFRLLVCDVDGTLVDSEERVTPEVAHWIAEAGRRGLTVCIASGRPQLGLLPLHRELQLTTPIISSGGADLYDPLEKRYLIHTTLAEADVRCIAAAGRAAGVTLLFEFTDQMILEGDPLEAEKLTQRVDFAIPVCEDVLATLNSMPTKIVLIGEDAPLVRLEREMSASCKTVYIARSQADFLDFTAAGVNKGTAIERLSKHLGILLDETAAIGDSFNDESMLDKAGLGVCVRNAAPALQQKADLIAPTNNEGAVAWLLEHLLAAP